VIGGFWLLGSARESVPRCHWAGSSPGRR
jgi:hypothetical protein